MGFLLLFLFFVFCMVFLQIPSPGGKVAPEGGRMRNAGGKLTVCTTYQTSKQVVTGRGEKQVFGFQVIEPCRPHSSSVSLRSTASPRGKHFGCYIKVYASYHSGGK